MYLYCFCRNHRYIVNKKGIYELRYLVNIVTIDSIYGAFHLVLWRILHTVYPEGLCLDRFVNISPLKMSGNVEYAAAIDTDLMIFSLSSWSDIKKV